MLWGKMAILAVLAVISCSDWKNVLGTLKLKQQRHEMETNEGDVQYIEVGKKWVFEKRWERKWIWKIYLAALMKKY